MSISSSQQSARGGLYLARGGGPSRNGNGTTPKESRSQREWEELVAREAMHQSVIEASFDRAEAYERVGDVEHALEWLDRVAALGGGLPPAYEAKRACWARAATVVYDRQRATRETGRVDVSSFRQSQKPG